jgi:hypothetical protein
MANNVLWKQKNEHVRVRHKWSKKYGFTLTEFRVEADATTVATTPAVRLTIGSGAVPGQANE